MIPKLVIVGRPNVGKSSLLNLLAGRRVSIVDPTAGVTRDRVSTYIDLLPANRGGVPRRVEVVDTGGYGIEDTQNLTAEVEQQIAYAIGEADLILFVVDALEGIAPLDREVAKLLHTSRGTTTHAPILLIANKTDTQHQEAEAYQTMQLGFGEPVMTSAVTGYNKFELLDAIRTHLPDTTEARQPGPADADEGELAEREMLVAVVGKRNAGKSTLVNALAGVPRVIVSELEGTTRDAVDVRFEMDGRSFIAIDTAGLRKGKSLANDIEYYSQHRALRSVRRADIVLFLIDATVPVSQVDKKLSTEIQRHYKPTVLVVNKWDLAEKKATQEEYADYLDKELIGLDYAPIVFTAASEGDGMREVMALALNLYDQAGHRVSTSKLNDIVAGILAQRGPSAKGGRRPRVYYVTQLEVHPPTIALFVNDPQSFTPEYQRFLINRFRDELPYSEVPIKLLIRQRRRSERGERREQGPTVDELAAARQQAAAMGAPAGDTGEDEAPRPDAFDDWE